MLHIIKDLHITVQNIFSGIAIVSQGSDYSAYTWKIINGENQPTITITYNINNKNDCNDEILLYKGKDNHISVNDNLSSEIPERLTAEQKESVCSDQFTVNCESVIKLENSPDAIYTEESTCLFTQNNVLQKFEQSEIPQGKDPGLSITELHSKDSNNISNHVQVSRNNIQTPTETEISSKNKKLSFFAINSHSPITNHNQYSSLRFLKGQKESKNSLNFLTSNSKSLDENSNYSNKFVTENLNGNHRITENMSDNPQIIKLIELENKPKETIEQLEKLNKIMNGNKIVNSDNKLLHILNHSQNQSQISVEMTGHKVELIVSPETSNDDRQNESLEKSNNNSEILISYEKVSDLNAIQEEIMSKFPNRRLPRQSCDFYKQLRQNLKTNSIKKSNSFNDKRNVCKFCGKKFTLVGNKNMHERIHTGEKPFSCRFCDKRFTYKSVMQTHERRHTGEEPFSCDNCDKSFKQLNALYYHQRCYHNDLLR